MEELIRNLKAAEDALDTYRANARISKKSDAEAEDRLIASVEHAKAQIQFFNEKKTAFWEKYNQEREILIRQHAMELDRLKTVYDSIAQENGYDN
jgi:hypothetical protein